MQDFHFVMRLNRASERPHEGVPTAQHIKTATWPARKAGKDQQENLDLSSSRTSCQLVPDGWVRGQKQS